MREVLCFIDSVVHDEAYCALDDVSFERRRRELARQSNGLQRLGELALHKLAGKSASYVRNYLEKPYQDAGYNVLGAGFRSTIYLTPGDTMVNKLHRGSVHMQEEEKLSLLSEYSARQESVEYFLGNYALKQSFSVEPHPFIKNRTAVIGRQPLIQFEPLPSAPDDISSNVRRQLTAFIDRSEELLYSTGYFVDIKGTNNLVVNQEDEALTLIDTIPCDPRIAPDRVLNGSFDRLEELKRLSGK